MAMIGMKVKSAAGKHAALAFSTSQRGVTLEVLHSPEGGEPVTLSLEDAQEFLSKALAEVVAERAGMENIYSKGSCDGFEGGLQGVVASTASSVVLESDYHEMSRHHGDADRDAATAIESAMRGEPVRQFSDKAGDFETTHPNADWSELPFGSKIVARYADIDDLAKTARAKELEGSVGAIYHEPQAWWSSPKDVSRTLEAHVAASPSADSPAARRAKLAAHMPKEEPGQEPKSEAPARPVKAAERLRQLRDGDE